MNDSHQNLVEVRRSSGHKEWMTREKLEALNKQRVLASAFKKDPKFGLKDKRGLFVSPKAHSHYSGRPPTTVTRSIFLTAGQ